MSESDVEHDLDELYDDDDNDNDNGFTVPDRLEAPVAKQYTTRELHELIHEGLIDLNPPYQRGTFAQLRYFSRRICSMFLKMSYGLMQNR